MVTTNMKLKKVNHTIKPKMQLSFKFLVKVNDTQAT